MAGNLRVQFDDPLWPDKVIAFWFDTLGPDVWFIKDQAVDEQITSQFLSLYHALFDKKDQFVATTANDTLATIIVLDQFPRNMFRNSSRAFGSDDVALRLSDAAIAAELDHELSPRRCQFLYMPFQHSEDAAMQARSVALYEKLGLENALDFARRHKDVIDRFGRFPHRNRVLGRASTDAELAYLAEPGSGF